MVVWRLPEPALPCAHPFKYRLVYVVEGERVIGFDNERGKGVIIATSEARSVPMRSRGWIA